MVSPWLVGFVAFTLYPFVASFYWSFCRYDLLGEPRWIGMGNYRRLLSELVEGGTFAQALGNTVYFALGSVALSVVLGVLLAVMLSWQVRELGLYDSLGALILPKFFVEAFYAFLLRQFFLTIPQEMIDAARVDGCSALGVLWRVKLPLACPSDGCPTGIRRDVERLRGPLLYLNDPDKFSLAYGLEQFVSAHSSEMHLLLAAAVLFTVPIVVLFFAAQRAFVRGITTTGLKG